MSVSSFDPSTDDRPTVSVSAAALRHLRGQLARSGQSCLRLGVKESGCNGYMYTLDYLDEPAADDHPQRVDDDVVIYVREGDLPLVRGTVVDYVTEGLNASLRFKNPNASTYCGCGESFAVAAAR